MATMMTGEHIAERYVQENPDATLTKNAIKCLLRGGCIPSVRAGNRRFFSYELFLAYLEEGNCPAGNDGYDTMKRIM